MDLSRLPWVATGRDRYARKPRTLLVDRAKLTVDSIEVSGDFFPAFSAGRYTLLPESNKKNKGNNNTMKSAGGS